MNNPQQLSFNQYNNRNNTRSNSSGYGGITIAGIILIVVVFLLIIGSVYWAYGIYTTRNPDSMVSVEVLPDVKDAASKFMVGSGSIPSSRYSNEFSISMWLNVHDYTYNYGKEKVIIKRDNLEIVLADTTNDLIVRVKQQTPNTIATITTTTTPITTTTTTTTPIVTDMLKSKLKVGVSKFSNVSGNEIDYPTVKYDIDKEDTSLNTFNKSALNNLTKSNIADNTNVGTDNPIIDNKYFSLVSGNNVISNPNQQQHYNFSADVQESKLNSSLNTNENISSIIQLPNQQVEKFDDSRIQNGECIYKRFPLQKWVHVIVSIYGQVVYIYIDGLLASTCVLKGFPSISTDDVSITPDGGFSGQISRVVFTNTAMTIPKAQSLYYDGPVPTTNILTMIPSWIWYAIILLIIIAIIYSVFV